MSRSKKILDRINEFGAPQKTFDWDAMARAEEPEKAPKKEEPKSLRELAKEKGSFPFMAKAVAGGPKIGKLQLSVGTIIEVIKGGPPNAATAKKHPGLFFAKKSDGERIVVHPDIKRWAFA